MGTPASVPYKRLTAHSPELDLEYLRDLRALYRGGRALLRNPAVFDRVFPKHEGETDKSYTERKRRAFYVNHLGAVIDYMVAGLAQDGLRYAEGEADKPKPDAYYMTFADDVAAPNADPMSFDEFMRKAACDALICSWSWVLVDLPTRDPSMPPAASQADQLASGEMDAYLVHLPCESVLDWECDANGVVGWANVHSCSRPRASVSDERTVTVHTYTIWDATSWSRFEVRIEDGKDPPPPDEMVKATQQGPHSFGRVPIVKLDLPDGLRAGDKLFSLAVEYLNKSCGLSWAEYRSLYQQLYEFLGPELPSVNEPIAAAQGDTRRAKRTRRGPGIVQERGADDRAEFVGPDASGFTHAKDSLQALRDDIYRVTHQMALAQDTQGAMIRRSGDSKAKDHAATEVVLGSLGKIVVGRSNVVLEMVAAGRGDDEAPDVVGMAAFNVEDVDTLISQAVQMETVSVPSARFQQLMKGRLARRVVGDDATDEDIGTIQDELEKNITNESFMTPIDPATGLPGERDPAKSNPSKPKGTPGAAAA